MMPKMITIDEMTRLLGIGKTTAYKLVRQMKHVKIGRRILIEEADLMHYIEKYSEAGKEEE